MKIELRLVLHFFVLHDVKAIKLLEHIIHYGKVWRNKAEWQVKILMVTDICLVPVRVLHKKRCVLKATDES